MKYKQIMYEPVEETENILLGYISTMIFTPAFIL